MAGANRKACALNWAPQFLEAAAGRMHAARDEDGPSVASMTSMPNWGSVA